MCSLLCAEWVLPIGARNIFQIFAFGPTRSTRYVYVYRLYSLQSASACMTYYLFNFPFRKSRTRRIEPRKTSNFMPWTTIENTKFDFVRSHSFIHRFIFARHIGMPDALCLMHLPLPLPRRKIIEYGAGSERVCCLRCVCVITNNGKLNHFSVDCIFPLFSLMASTNQRIHLFLAPQPQRVNNHFFCCPTDAWNTFNIFFCSNASSSLRSFLFVFFFRRTQAPCRRSASCKC